MSKFERSSTRSAWTGGRAERRGRVPDDFTSDERDFAAELHALFSPEAEELPPLYAQTLLENERHAPTERGFEQRLSYRVFQRLHLRRDLGLRPAWGLPWVSGLGARLSGLRRPLVGAMAAAMALMLLTILLATPSFADGLRIILGQTGVTQLPSYPTRVQSSGTHGDPTPQPVTLDPTMPLAWLGRSNSDYLYKGMRLQNADYASGPVVDIQYAVARSTRGSGLLDIREFRINPAYRAVLQVVQTGHAFQVSVGGSPAVYVDGIWMPRASRWPMRMGGDGNPSQYPQYVWATGQRSELILERDGVILWIVGDQRDGTDQNALVHVAEMLQDVKPAALQPSRLALLLAGESLTESFQEPPGHEVLDYIPVGASYEADSGALVASMP
ncbi:MAG TPA: hypothetical protein VFU88_19130 [Ktedonobacterales bacterium]|nr:hypothetical protein [Ktedonobacterales bacterium]